MSSELDLRGLDRAYDPDPAFVERLRQRLVEASTDAVDAAERVDYVEIAPDPRLDGARPSRRRIVLLAAAVIVVIAVASAVAWRVLDGSDATTYAGSAEAVFLGAWASTDTDGSSQTLDITVPKGTRVEIVVHDAAATAACAGAAATMTGAGELDSTGDLVITISGLVCEDGSAPAVPAEDLGDLVFAYDRASDTLTDNSGVVWRRPGADDVTAPRTSGTMWPQSTTDEVRQAQERADAGDPAYTWQVDPQLSSDNYDVWWPHLRAGGAEIAQRFLREELGWDHALFNPFEAGTGADDGVIRDAVYLRCAPGETDPLYPLPPPAEHQEALGAEGCAPTIDDLHYETVRLDLDQLDRRDSDGIWVVSRWAMSAPFAQTDPNVAEAEATAQLEEFLGARLAGAGAEGYVDVVGDSVLAEGDEVPLLYATTAGAPYERYEIERVGGPWWPYGEMEFTVRLFADGGGTVVEQPIAWSDVGGPRLALVQSDTETTENGQPVAVTYEYGELTMSAAAPWDSTTFPIVALRLGDEEPGGIELLADPRTVGTGCDNGPAPADANALAASIQADPDIEATAPEAVTIGGTGALAMDVTVAPAASVCSTQGSPLVLGDKAGERYGLSLADGSRMRLYLVDVPVGSTTRLFAIAIVAPEARFDDVMAAAAPVIESIEFHTQ
jgi:hypothetical protein